ncbi:MAG: hypothetical protein ABI390_11085 [Daejeonella sp.]
MNFKILLKNTKDLLSEAHVPVMIFSGSGYSGKFSYFQKWILIETTGAIQGIGFSKG